MGEVTDFWDWCATRIPGPGHHAHPSSPNFSMGRYLAGWEVLSALAGPTARLVLVSALAPTHARSYATTSGRAASGPVTRLRGHLHDRPPGRPAEGAPAPGSPPTRDRTRS